MSEHDSVNHPAHYTGHPLGVECIELSRYLCFRSGNAFKYLWRCGLKGDPLEDLRKARWYLTHLIDHPATPYYGDAPVTSIRMAAIVESFSHNIGRAMTLIWHGHFGAMPSAFAKALSCIDREIALIQSLYDAAESA